MVSPNEVLEKCKRAGIDFWIGSKTSLELKDELEGDIGEEEIQRKIYETLKNYSEEAAERFRNYHSIEVRTTDGKLQPFNKEKIVKSLLRETYVPRTVAKEVADQISEDVRRLKLQNISSSLIREMVNAKLLEKRHINEKRNYTRIGLPIYDTKKIIEEKEVSDPTKLHEEFSSRVLKEYTLTKALPRKLSQEHLKGHIHIHNIEGFVTRPISLKNNLRNLFKEGIKIPKVVETGPAQNPEVAASHAARSLLISKRYTSGGTSIDSLNTLIAPYLKELDREEIQQVAQTFLYELNQVSAHPLAYTVNLDQKIPEELKEEETVVKGEKTGIPYKEYSEEAEKFKEIFLETYKKGDYKDNTFKFPNICIKHEEPIENPEKLPRPIYLINGGLKESLTYMETVPRDKKGVMQTISLNLPSYPLEEETRFHEKLKQEINTTKEIMKKKKTKIKEKKKELLSFMETKTKKEEKININQLSYNLSLIGLIKSMKKLNNTEKITRETEKQTKKTIRKIKRELKDKEIDIYLSQEPDKEALEKFQGTGTAEEITQFTKKPNKVTKNMQKHFKGGCFLETEDESMLEENYKLLKLI